MDFNLSQDLIVAIVSGVFSLLSVLIKINRESKLSRITDERTKWREQIRDIALKLSVISINAITAQDEIKLNSILTELKMRINTYGKYREDYLSDSHIWQCLSKLEDSNKRNNEEKNKLIEFLSALLKYDWQRSKIEASINIIEILGYCIYIASNVLFAYSLYHFDSNYSVFSMILVILIFSLYFFSPSLFMLMFKIVDIKRAWADLIVSYGMSILILLCLLCIDRQEAGHVLGPLVTPIILQIVALVLLAISNFEEFKNISAYKKVIENLIEEEKETIKTKAITVVKKEQKANKKVKAKIKNQKEYFCLDGVVDCLKIKRKLITCLWCFFKRKFVKPIRHWEKEAMEKLDSKINELEFDIHN